MQQQTLFISQPAHLSLQYAQLIVRFKEREGWEQFPIEDLAFVVLEHPRITLTHQLLGELAEENVMVICCGSTHLPVGSLLSFKANYIQTARFRKQTAASEPLKKQLWKRTVKAKIGAQAETLACAGCEGAEALIALTKEVKSGDPTNVEGRAASYYWEMLFGSSFCRHPQGPPPNHALNYGYTILCAAMARALAGHGLLNTLGIHHQNQYNAFCLASDIMEPYRPFVDLVVYEMHQTGMGEELTPAHKKKLLQLLTMDVRYEENTTTLGNALGYTAYSLATCFEHSDSEKLIFARHYYVV